MSEHPSLMCEHQSPLLPTIENLSPITVSSTEAKHTVLIHKHVWSVNLVIPLAERESIHYLKMPLLEVLLSPVGHTVLESAWDHTVTEAVPQYT